MKRGHVTSLLQRVNSGDEAAEDELFRLTYDDLAVLAHRYVQWEKSVKAADTRSVVHEVYMRLFSRDAVKWRDRKHFFVLAARAMRRLLIDRARAARADKRGGRAEDLALEHAHGVPHTEPDFESDEALHLLSVKHALDKLRVKDPTLFQVIEMRFFRGMTVPETAEALGLSSRSVNREWRAGQAYLYSHLLELYETISRDQTSDDEGEG